MIDNKVNNTTNNNDENDSNNSSPDKTNNNNKTSFFQNVINNLKNKPVKKMYRLAILGILAYIVNNTNGVNISNIVENILKQQICNNNNETIAAIFE